MTGDVDKIEDFESYMIGRRRGYKNALIALRAIPHTHQDTSVVIKFDDLRALVDDLKKKSESTELGERDGSS